MFKPLNYVTAKSIRSAFKMVGAEVAYKHLIGPYFSEKGPQRWLTGIAALSAGKVGGEIFLTYVVRNLINQMNSRNYASFIPELALLGGTLFVTVLANRAQALTSDHLCQSLTYHSQKEMGRMWTLLYSKGRPDVKNPEQRMIDNITEFVKITHQLSDVPLKAVDVLVCSFILYSISPALLAGTCGIGLAGIWITKRISRKQTKQEQIYTDATASYRQLVTTIHGHQASILNGGGPVTILGMLDDSLGKLNHAARAVITTRNLTNSVSEMVDNISTFLPYTMAALTFFSPVSRMTLGSFRQGQDVSHKLNESASWPRRNMSLLKQWEAYAKLITEFINECMIGATVEKPISVLNANLPVSLSVHELKLRDSQGSLLCDNICFQLRAGDSLAILGPTGSGKSRLLATLADVVHHCEGSIDYTGIMPQSGDIMYVPAENPMLQLSLRQLLSFPQTGKAFSDEAIENALRLAGLGCKVVLMDESLKYGRDFRFSDGEKNRFAFARSFLLRPKILCLDNPTAHLPINEGVALYRTMMAELPDSTILCSSTCKAIVSLHNQTGVIGREGLSLSRKTMGNYSSGQAPDAPTSSFPSIIPALLPAFAHQVPALKADKMVL